MQKKENNNFIKTSQVFRNTYRDSLFLMRLSNEISAKRSVKQAVILMATTNNKNLLAELGFSDERIDNAGMDDLIIALEIDNKINSPEFLNQIEKQIKNPQSSGKSIRSFTDLDSALSEFPHAPIVIISTPGQYAAQLIRSSIKANRHVFCFSQHVSTEDELELKHLAITNDVLLMGPDCGTSIIDGIGFGFSNKINVGPIGLVSASGSGLQEVTSLIHKMGSGITQAIGVGGNDMKYPLNGLMAEFGLNLLENDPKSEVIVILSKKSSKEAAARILKAAKQNKKPLVVNFLMPDFIQDKQKTKNIYFADTYEECAKIAVEVSGGPKVLLTTENDFSNWMNDKLGKIDPSRNLVRGLYGGGSLSGEAINILEKSGISVDSIIDNPNRGSSFENHLVLDLGDEEYTKGRPHPFIDHRLRSIEINKSFRNQKVGIVLLDVVLGWGSHHDPAGEVVKAVKDSYKKYGDGPAIIASIIGTDEDFQDMQSQKQKLISQDIYVARSNASAVRLAVQLHQGMAKKS